MIRFLWLSRGEDATLRFGRALGRALAGPAWIGLSGPLGAGKTRLAQGIAAGLGYRGRVRSPSFVLEHRYRGRLPILHLDLYRLEAPGADLEAGWEESEAVVLVEWSERVTAPPDGAMTLRIHPVAGVPAPAPAAAPGPAPAPTAAPAPAPAPAEGAGFPNDAARWIELIWPAARCPIADLRLEGLLRAGEES